MQVLEGESMKEFTFATITYNQQSYIIEHLESIKRQIEMFGGNYQITFLLSDDCSRDNTVALAEKWIAQHRALFHEVIILANKENQGVVKNYTIALRNIKTRKFKILAGDDFYFQNDVFKAAFSDTFVVSPTLKLYETGIEKDPERWLYKEYLLTKKSKLKKAIRNKLKYQMSVETPGVFWDASLIDEGLYEALEPYRWIEDIPEWNYLLSKKATSVSMWNAPLIVYRMSSGISQNTKHEKNLQFEEEVRNIRARIQTHAESKFYRSRQKMVCRIIKYLLRNNEKICAFNEYIMQAEESAQDYVSSIQTAAAAWINEYGVC